MAQMAAVLVTYSNIYEGEWLGVHDRFLVRSV